MQRAFTLMFALASLGACAADNGDDGIFITKNVVPGAGCTFSATESSPFLSHGTYSIHANASYQLHPQMKSRITARVGQEDQRTVIIQGARVELTFADAGRPGALFSSGEIDEMRTAAVTRFETRFTAPLPPNGGIADGDVALINTNLLDRIIAKNPDAASPTSTQSFRAEILASVVVFGDMAGSEVESNTFTFPVTICNDCVSNIIGACPLAAGTTVRSGNECNSYQDGIVDCCAMGNDVICPGIVGTSL